MKSYILRCILIYCGIAAQTSSAHLLTVNVDSTTSGSVQISWSTALDAAATSSQFSVQLADSTILVGPLDIALLQSSGTLIIDSGLSAGVQYQIELKGNMNDETLTSFTATTLPGTPSLTNVVPDANNPGGITIQWTPASGSTQNSFKISYIATFDDGSSSSTDVSDANAVEHTLSLTPGNEYKFTIRALLNTDTVSEESNSLTSSTYPVAATIETTTSTADSFTVNWDHTENGLYSGFSVVYSPDDGNPSSGITSGQAARSETITGLTAGTLYTITLNTESNYGQSSSVTSQVTTVPKMPSNLRAQESTVDSIQITWDHNDGTRESYKILYKKSTDSTDTIIDNVNASLTMYTIVNLEAGFQYSIRMVAVSGGLDSAVSDSIQKFTKPKAVAGLTISDGSTTSSEIAITWTFQDNPGTREAIRVAYTSTDGSGTVTPDLNSDAMGTTISGLAAGYEYTITVITVVGLGGMEVTSTEERVMGFTLPNTPVITIGDNDVTTTSIVISIDGGSGARDRYSVTYGEVGGPSSSEDVIGNSQMETYPIDGLQAQTQYSIIVTAHRGTKEASSNETLLFTAPNPPVNVTVTTSSSTVISVEWIIVQGLSYEVEFKKSGSSANPATVPDCTTSPCSADVSSAGGPGTEVTVFVYAVVDGRRSSQATAQGNTQPHPPTAIEEVHSEKGPDTLVFTTTKPSDTVVTRLQVVTSPQGLTVQISEEGNTYTIRLTDLEPGVQYSISAYFLAGMAQSDPVMATAFTRPPTPGAISRSANTETTLTVNWIAVLGAFSEYRATIETQEQSAKLVDANALNPEVTFVSLTPGTLYTVTVVTVVTQNGQQLSSIPATAEFRTKPSPVSTITLISSTLNTVSFSWSEPGPGNYTKFEVKRIGDNDAQEVQRGQRLEATFSGLSAGTALTFEIVVFSETEPSFPTQNTFYTHPNSGSLTISSFTETSITVNYDGPTDNAFSEFNITLYENNVAQVSITKARDSEEPNSHRFDSAVEPGTQYKVGLKVVLNTPHSPTQGSLESEDVYEEVTTKPKPARNIEFSSKDETSITVSWLEPDQTAAVDGYTVIVTRPGESNHVRNTDVTTGTMKSFTELTPGATYRISVTAFTLNHENHKVESSPATASEQDVTMVPSQPGAIQINEEDIGGSTIALSWGAASNEFDNYVVRWKVAGSSDTYMEKDVASNLLTTTIDGLSRGTEYEIKVVTESGAERSDPISIFRITNPDIVDLNIDEISTDTLKVSWSAPNNVDSYLLTISPPPSNLQDGTKTVEAGTLAYTFTTLTPGQTYTMSIAVTIGGTTGDSQQRVQTTKPSPVTNLAIGQVSTTSIELSWNVEQNSIQERFDIRYRETNPTQGTENVESVNHSAGQTIYSNQRVDGLEPGRTYEISVQAVSSTESGNIESGAQVTQITRPKPVTSLLGQSTGTRTATLTWVADPESHQTAFRLTRMGEAHDTTLTTLTEQSAETAQLMVDGLFPGERYTYTIVAVSGTEQSTEVTFKVVQRPLAPSGVDINDDDRNSNNLPIIWTYDSSQYYQNNFRVDVRESGSDDIARSEVIGQMSHTIVGLTSGQSYTINVFALTFENKQSDSTSITAFVKPRITAHLREDEESTTTSTVTILYSPELSDVVVESYVFSINNLEQTRINKTAIDEREVTFSNLLPGTLYYVSGRAVSGDQTSDKSDDLPVLTRPGTPEVECDRLPNNITLIIKDPQSGDFDSFKSRCEQCGQDEKVSPDDSMSDSIRVLWDNLNPFTTYTFRVRSSQSLSLTGGTLEKDGMEVTKSCVTEPAAPGPIQDLSAETPLTNSIKIKWKEPQIKNGVIIKYTISYVGVRPGSRDHISEKISLEPQSDPQHIYENVFDDLKGGYNYSFTVFATTDVVHGTGKGEESTIYELTPVDAPTIRNNYQPPQEPVNDVDHKSAVVKFRNPFDDKNGAIIAYSVIISKRNRELPTTESTWANPQSETYSAIYRCDAYTFFNDNEACASGNPSRGTGRRKRQASNEEVDVLLGSNQNCNSDHTSVYCNGPLSASTEYFVYLRGYTDNTHYTDYNEPYTFRTGKEPKTDSGDGSDDVTVIIAAAVGAVVLLVIIVIIIAVVLLRRGGSATSGKPPHSDFLTLRETHTSSDVPQNRPIRLSEFKEHVTNMSKDSDFLFAEEYEELKEVGKDQAWENAIMPVNRVKNRFTNILPYDHSRVKLLPSEDEEGSDYINASWMPGFNSKREFICAQGPLPATIDDFWRMVWEQNVRAIVMLTRCVEKGRDKCAHYWPVDSEPMYYGDVQVEIRNEIKSQEWVITEFSISKGETVRRITHFHYIAWPDFDVPKVPQSLIRFVRTVRSKLQGEGGPTVVHCSAGVGRSGTFIVVDRLLQHIATPHAEFIDIYSIVHEMRRFRCWMVQTESQYIFIHRCILCVLEGKENEHMGDGEINPAFEDADEGIQLQP